MAIEPVESEPQAPVYPQNRFIVLLVILVLLVALVGVAQRMPQPTTELGGFSQETLAGDTAMKFAYAWQRWQSSLPYRPGQRQQAEVFYERQRLSAIDSYREAVRDNPSPQTIRRLIIIEYPGKRAAEINRLASLALKNPAKAKEIRAEAAMWRAIYDSKEPLTPQELSSYPSRIRGLGLGWYESLALADLYDRAGMTKEAKAASDQAASMATHTVLLLLALLAIVITFGFVGIFVIVWYVNAEKTGRLPAYDPPQPDGRGLVAGRFLETFVVYLGVVIATQVIAGAVLATRAVPPSPKTVVLATAGVYTLGGVLAAIYLAYRLRAAGWSWKMLGFTSHNPGLDILWGMLGYAAALPILLIASLLSQIASRYIPTPSNPIVPLFLQSDTILQRLLLFGLTIVAAPFFEEMFFRGVLFHSFQAKWGVRLGLILSAVVFASVHPLPLGFLPIFVLGYVLATLLYRRGSLLPCMVMHAMNNSVAFLALLILMGP